ncbi:hypothetical protein HGH93_03660 [Chitinophaga polysaccharea]|uniref:hypothetical protein n=1 Tax=Chitinophaga TaxID=79328 RepID=UPI0014550618|nr:MULTISPECIES: hypothetical protein [Chitinophaga]NLR57177.1 hypothetical protein [Chitinophaga polysaccharea]NLU91699.1 hypothetical protein [Chitinophaga sp. Ak27]
MNKKDKAALAKQLLSAPPTKVYIYVDGCTTYRMLIIYRGEGLFYAENDHCLILEKFSAREAKVSLEGTEQWLDGEPVADKALLARNLKDFYKRSYKDDLNII